MTKGCPKCGRMVEANVDFCPYCHYHFTQTDKVAIIKENDNKKVINETASFLQRIVAFNIDLYIMIGVYILIKNMLQITIIWQAFSIVMLYPLFVTIFIYLIYSFILELSPLKGTIGDRLVGIMVVDEDSYQIDLKMAFKRVFGKILNILTLFIGFIILPFTKNKQTLDDYISETYVKNRTTEYNTKLFYAHIPLRIVAFILDVLILIFIYYALTLLNTIISINVNILIIIITILYFSILDSKLATIGKQIFAFKVTDLNGKNINVITSFIRLILAVAELLPLGFLLAITKPTKQTLKDTLTHTSVIKIVYQKDFL